MKKVLITGGQGGLAEAITQLLERQGGYQVYAPGKDELDVTSLDMIAAVMKKFVPDILINNAGYVVPQSVKDADPAISKKHFDINLTGTFYCTELALKRNPDLMIVNIGSSAATKVHATWSEYCASKAAVVMATRCWAEDGLYTVCISPGRAATKMRRRLFPDEDQSTLLRPEDFAQVVWRAIQRQYPSGSHIQVNKQNVEELIYGKN